MEVNKVNLENSLADNLKKTNSQVIPPSSAILGALNSNIAPNNLQSLNSLSMKIGASPNMCSEYAPNSAQTIHQFSHGNWNPLSITPLLIEKIPIYQQIASQKSLLWDKSNILGDLNVNNSKNSSFNSNQQRIDISGNSFPQPLCPMPYSLDNYCYSPSVQDNQMKNQYLWHSFSKNIYNQATNFVCPKNDSGIEVFGRNQSNSAFTQILNNQDSAITTRDGEWEAKVLSPKGVNVHDLVVSKTEIEEDSLERKTKIVTKWEHTSRKHYAKGMCSTCYHKGGRTKKAWNCEHKDELHYAKGCCQECYLIFHSKRGKNKLKKLMNEKRRKMKELQNQKEAEACQN